MDIKSLLAKIQSFALTDSGGFHHWWHQRITALALIPLSVWFGFALAELPGSSYDAVAAWLGSPMNALLMVAFIICAFYHAILGIQVVFEDYVQTESLRHGCNVLTRLLLIFLGLVSVFAILKLVFMG